MLFNSKPLVYLQLLDQSIRYLAVNPKDGSIIDKNKIVFDTNILEDGKITNIPLLETRLDALVKEKKWKNAKAHILLMNDYVTVREETVPSQLTPSEIKDYLNLHISHSIRMPFDNPIFAFDVYEKNEEEQKIVIMAYPGAPIKQYQQILRNVSLKPEVADIIALSLYRIAENRELINKEEGHHTLILEWNPYDTSIMVFHKDRPIFNRHSQTLRLSEAWELSQKGKWSWRQSEAELETVIEDQLDGLARFLDFYRYSVLDGEGGVSEIILTGYYPELSTLKNRLDERFSMNVHLLELPEGINQPFSALYGLTLKEGPKKSRKHKGGRKND